MKIGNKFEIDCYEIAIIGLIITMCLIVLLK